jgi:hypothetical protein
MTVRTMRIAVLAAMIVVSSGFVAMDAPAASPLARAKSISINQARPDPSVVLLVVSDTVGDGIALVATAPQ